MTELFVGIVLVLSVLAALLAALFWRPAFLVLAVVAALILVGCTDGGAQPGCEDLESSILAKEICARLKNCELTAAQVEQWMRDARAYRLHCASPEIKLRPAS